MWVNDRFEVDYALLFTSRLLLDRLTTCLTRDAAHSSDAISGQYIFSYYAR